MCSHIILQAKYYYIAGFFLTVSPDTIMHVAQHAHENGKVNKLTSFLHQRFLIIGFAHCQTFCMGLAAPFVCQFYTEPLLKVTLSVHVRCLSF